MGMSTSFGFRTVVVDAGRDMFLGGGVDDSSVW